MRCTLMRYTPEVYAHEVHAREAYAHEVHACEMYVYEVHTSGRGHHRGCEASECLENWWDRGLIQQLEVDEEIRSPVR